MLGRGCFAISRVICGAAGQRESACGNAGRAPGGKRRPGAEKLHVRRGRKTGTPGASAGEGGTCVCKLRRQSDWLWLRHPLPPAPAPRDSSHPAPASWLVGPMDGGGGSEGRGGARGLRAGAARRPARPFRRRHHHRRRRRACCLAEGPGLCFLLLPPRLPLPAGSVCRCRWDPVSSPAPSTVSPSGSPRARSPPSLRRPSRWP